MNPIAEKILIAVGTALVMWAMSWIRVFLAKRVRVQGPEAEALKMQGDILAKLCPAVNILIECKGPELEMLIALGEASQGKNNGNVTDALELVREKAKQFDSFKNKSARIDVASAEAKSA